MWQGSQLQAHLILWDTLSPPTSFQIPPSTYFMANPPPFHQCLGLISHFLSHPVTQELNEQAHCSKLIAENPLRLYLKKVQLIGYMLSIDICWKRNPVETVYSAQNRKHPGYTHIWIFTIIADILQFCSAWIKLSVSYFMQQCIIISRCYASIMSNISHYNRKSLCLDFMLLLQDALHLGPHVFRGSSTTPRLGRHNFIIEFFFRKYRHGFAAVRTNEIC